MHRGKAAQQMRTVTGGKADRVQRRGTTVDEVESSYSSQETRRSWLRGRTRKSYWRFDEV